MATVGNGMMIDTVDQADKPIGQVTRREVFQSGANFRVSHVFIFNSSGDLLIQRLALTRDRNPGSWGSSVASYLFASENYEDAARRRVNEELGISEFSLTLLGKTEMIDEGSLKFITLFRSESNGPFLFDPAHIDIVEFVGVHQIEQMIETKSRVFTPTFLHVFDFYRSLQPAE